MFKYFKLHNLFFDAKLTKIMKGLFRFFLHNLLAKLIISSFKVFSLYYATFNECDYETQS